MVFFYRSPQAIVISALCSIAIAAFIYFVIVKPQTDSANDQVNHALQQAQPSINRAQKLQDCILAAGTDTAKIAACNK
jgi:hypothetical protein